MPSGAQSKGMPANIAWQNRLEAFENLFKDKIKRKKWGEHHKSKDYDYIHKFGCVRVCIYVNLYTYIYMCIFGDMRVSLISTNCVSGCVRYVFISFFICLPSVQISELKRWFLQLQLDPTHLGHVDVHQNVAGLLWATATTSNAFLTRILLEHLLQNDQQIDGFPVSFLSKKMLTRFLKA